MTSTASNKGFHAGNYYSLKVETFSPTKSSIKGHECIDVVFSTVTGNVIKERYYMNVCQQKTFDLFNACGVNIQNPNKLIFKDLLGKTLSVKIGLTEWSKVIEHGVIISKTYLMIDLHSKLLPEAILNDLNNPSRIYNVLVTQNINNKVFNEKQSIYRQFLNYFNN